MCKKNHNLYQSKKNKHDQLKISQYYIVKRTPKTIQLPNRMPHESHAALSHPATKCFLIGGLLNICDQHANCYLRRRSSLSTENRSCSQSSTTHKNVRPQPGIGHGITLKQHIAAATMMAISERDPCEIGTMRRASKEHNRTRRQLLKWFSPPRCIELWLNSVDNLADWHKGPTGLMLLHRSRSDLRRQAAARAWVPHPHPMWVGSEEVKGEGSAKAPKTRFEGAIRVPRTTTHSAISKTRRGSRVVLFVIFPNPLLLPSYLSTHSSRRCRGRLLYDMRRSSCVNLHFRSVVGLWPPSLSLNKICADSVPEISLRAQTQSSS